MDFPDLTTVLIWLLQAAVAFVASTFLFDALHYLLHIWRDSRFALLRMFASWHWVHHEFLDRKMQVNKSMIWQNIWAHILPEFLTGVAGTLLFLLIFPWQPIAFVIAIRIYLLIDTIRQEGIDANHMAMDRVGGQQNSIWVDANYHAMHHVFPSSFFSSFLNVFDFVFGKSCHFKDRKFAVTGASGAFGSALVTELERRGAHVKTLKHDIDFNADSAEQAREVLEWADVLVLSHGAKTVDCMNANCTSFVRLIDLYRDIGQSRLMPPEIWGLGSEAEFHGAMGNEEIVDYADSKRAFARYAKGYYLANDLIYRHIVPSSFTSQMGKGPISAGTAVKIALFFITRGFRYVPVTMTSLAIWNYLRFRFQRVDGPTASSS